MLKTEFSSDKNFVRLDKFFGFENFFIKLEGLNRAGSIKLKTAISLLDGLEKNAKISPKTHTIIESSSGNLGIALALICKERGYKFICVCDPNIAPKSREYIESFGGKIISVTKRDASGGYLGSRIELIQKMLSEDKNLVWTNQYASRFNIDAHYNMTAKEIFAEFPNLDYLFIGAGTTGTLMGCAKFFKEFSPKTKIIAVDSIGSVTFGQPPQSRYIPGLGTSRKPEIFSPKNIDEAIFIAEKDTILMCHYLQKNYDLFLGGSSGTVACAIKNYANKIPSGASIVMISPDMGEKYSDTIYNPIWVKEKFNFELKNEQ